MAFPNIRQLFRPDPGYLILEGDLKQADAQVVAWDAGDEKLKRIFRDGLDLHNENTKTIFGVCTGDKDPNRYKAKQGVHLTNYGGTAKVLASTINIPTAEAERFQQKWFEAHPEIKRWQNRIEREVQTTRTIRNAFGFKRRFFDRVDYHLIKQALAWIPQSTVALTINHAWRNIEQNLPEVDVLLQVHDSLVMQFKESLFPAIVPRIREQMLIRIPYPDPLIIPVDFKVSDKSWGDCKPHKLEDSDVVRLPHVAA